jgi:lysophospholipase L1-like esterase
MPNCFQMRAPLNLGVAAMSLALTSCAGGGMPKPAWRARGGAYVAMGSSFAAGPAVATSADSPPNRCARSSENYAHQLARMRNLQLSDVSCSGATTAHLLGPWNGLAPQVDALRLDTQLVTVTIGGNDVGYIGSLMAGSCEPSEHAGPAIEPICKGMRRAAPAGSVVPPPPDEQAWQNLAGNLRRIVQEVRGRSPHANLIFVDYLTVLPQGRLCAAAPLSAQAAERTRRVAARLSALTAKIAREAGAAVIKASELSRRHDACAPEPWVTGFMPRPGGGPFAPYHPNLAGMSAIAAAIDQQLPG